VRVVVTGGCGFVGSRLVLGLVARGDEVSVIDIAGRPLKDAALHLVSVLERDRLVPLLRGADIVVHLAGYVREEMRRKPAAGTTLQIDGTRNVLDAAVSCGVPRIVLASSFYVYAACDTTLVDETAPIDPAKLEPFGQAKLASEALCRRYAERGSIGFTSLRLGSAYGAGGTNAVRAFLTAGFRGETIEVWGDGSRRNQYTFVGDLAAGITAVLGRPAESRDQIFNLVAPSVTTTAELAGLLAQTFGFRITFRGDRPDGPAFPYMHSEKATDLLGWHTLPLVDGLRLTATELGYEVAAAVR
jgi:UDP-glucose 4-epimerase